MTQVENTSMNSFALEINIGCVLMASGFSKRFGNDNKLLQYFNGKKLFELSLDQTDSALITARVAVTRYSEIRDICKAYDIPAVLHCLPNRSDTIRLGLEFLLKNEDDLSGCLFCQCDQPILTKATIETLCLALTEHPDCIIRPRCDGQVGSPVLFSSCFFPELLSLSPGDGGRAVIKKNPDRVCCVDIKDARELYDIDTREALQELLRSSPFSS